MRILAPIALALLPLAAVAQQQYPAFPDRSIEIGVGLSSTPDNQDGKLQGGMPRMQLSALRSRNRFQYGFSLEAGTNTINRGYLVPAALANYRIVYKTGYWYGGAMLGFVWMGYQKYDAMWSEGEPIRGYAFGLQTGYVQHIYGRLSATVEVSARSSQTWETYERLVFPEYPGPASRPVRFQYRAVNSVLYVPIGIGIRYRI